MVVFFVKRGVKSPASIFYMRVNGPWVPEGVRAMERAEWLKQMGEEAKAIGWGRSLPYLFFLAMLSWSLAPALADSSSFTARTYGGTRTYQGLHESNLSITYPIMGVPFWVRPGGELRITLMMHGEVQGELQVRLSRHGVGRDLVFEVNMSEDCDLLLLARVPGNILDGLYDLEVWKGDAYDIEINAVFVGQEKDAITLVHVTDPHLTEETYSDPNAAALARCVDMINLIHPDIVILTGDYDEPRLLGDMILRNLEVPVYMTPGNHDANNNEYGVYLNPYPDYAFDFGPARFVSLDQNQVAGSTFGMLTDDQCVFTETEFSQTEKQKKIVFCHTPWYIDSQINFSYDLLLVGDLHRDICMDLGKVYVFSAPGRFEALTLINLTKNQEISCKSRKTMHLTDQGHTGAQPRIYRAGDLFLPQLVVEPPLSGQRYQKLEIVPGWWGNQSIILSENSWWWGDNLEEPLLWQEEAQYLDLFPADCCWEFVLSPTEPGWKTVVLGGLIERTTETPENTYIHVQFNPSQTTLVEAFLVPTTPDAAQDLGSMIANSIDEYASTLEIIQSFAPFLQENMTKAEALLTEALISHQSGDWTGAAIEYFRAIHIFEPIRKLADSIPEAVLKLERHREAGMNVSVVTPWFEMVSYSLYPNLSEARAGSTGPIEYLLKIIQLDETQWEMADLIAKAQVRLTHMVQSGQVIDRVKVNYNRREWDPQTEAEYLIAYGNDWFLLEDFYRVDYAIQALRHQFPDLMGISEEPLALIMIILFGLIYRISLYGSMPRIW